MHTQYMLLTHDDDLLYLQLHTGVSRFFFCYFYLTPHPICTHSTQDQQLYSRSLGYE